MSKAITINHEGCEYTLEFTRNTVRMMEAAGFNMEDIREEKMLNTRIMQLIEGAFLAHHKTVRTDKIYEIYSKIKNKGDFLLKLGELYNEPANALMEEPEEGNSEWTANW